MSGAHSGARTNTRGGSSMKHSESEILNDAGIWHVSSSDDESEPDRTDVYDSLPSGNSAD